MISIFLPFFTGVSKASCSTIPEIKRKIYWQEVKLLVAKEIHTNSCLNNRSFIVLFTFSAEMPSLFYLEKSVLQKCHFQHLNKHLKKINKSFVHSNGNKLMRRCKHPRKRTTEMNKQRRCVLRDGFPVHTYSDHS